MKLSPKQANKIVERLRESGARVRFVPIRTGQPSNPRIVGWELACTTSEASTKLEAITQLAEAVTDVETGGER